MEVEPRGERGTEPPEAEARRPEGDGVTIGEPQTIGRPQVIGSPQVIGTPQVIGGERAGGAFPGSEVRTDVDGRERLDPDAPDAAQAYGGSSDVTIEAGSGAGGSETWTPGEDRVEAEPPEAATEDSETAAGAGGWQLPPEAPDGEMTRSETIPEEDDDARDADWGWMQPQSEAEAWGGTEWMQPDAEAAGQAPGVGGSGPWGEAGLPQTSSPASPGGANGGSAGGELLSPGLVIGPTDPETGALIDPRTGEPQFAQSTPEALRPSGEAPGDLEGDADTAASSGAPGAPSTRETPLEEAVDSLTELNAASVELEEAQLEVLESQLARQEAAEAARRQDEEAAAWAARQRLVAARMLEQGELALAEGETDLGDELAEARALIVEEAEVASTSGRYRQLRELSEALDRLDAAELAADANNGLEAQRWLLEARRLLLVPAGPERGVETRALSP